VSEEVKKKEEKEKEEKEKGEEVGGWLILGYGQSDKPHGTSTHIEYSKRIMADDMVQLMYVSPLLY
jgi:hypothetical protein